MNFDIVKIVEQNKLRISLCILFIIFVSLFVDKNNELKKLNEQVENLEDQILDIENRLSNIE